MREQLREQILSKGDLGHLLPLPQSVGDRACKVQHVGSGNNVVSRRPYEELPGEFSPIATERRGRRKGVVVDDLPILKG